MLRNCLVLLLLVHYLLVVGAGFVGRTEPVRQRAADYVHSVNCQQQHYLQLDCFDHCNGEQYVRVKPNQRQSLPQLLDTVKGLDVHCLRDTPVIVGVPVGVSAEAETSAVVLFLPTGFSGTLYAPPRWG
ncbi:hypothetical protein [uncultured Hymenobacter sp.]|uniref:hypothetical protein n=1 Tax=uncultured Hymenobacter sp. TaxID=170016 RepID=UPI0035CA052C